MMLSSGPEGFKIGKNARLFFVVSSGGPDDKTTYHPESTAIIRILAYHPPLTASLKKRRLKSFRKLLQCTLLDGPIASDCFEIFRLIWNLISSF